MHNATDGVGGDVDNVMVAIAIADATFGVQVRNLACSSLSAHCQTRWRTASGLPWLLQPRKLTARFDQHLP